MARSTHTRRTPRPTVPKGEPERLDLGTVVLPKGTFVEATTVGGETVHGALLSVEHRDGVPYTAGLWVIDGDRRAARHVYVDTVQEV